MISLIDSYLSTEQPGQRQLIQSQSNLTHPKGDDPIREHKANNTNRICNNDDRKEIGSTTIVLGFRHPNKDFLYSSDWKYFIESSTMQKKASTIERLLQRVWFNNSAENRLETDDRNACKENASHIQPWKFNLITAFSRYWKDRTVYVQDALEEHPEQVNVFSGSFALTSTRCFAECLFCACFTLRSGLIMLSYEFSC